MFSSYLFLQITTGGCFLTQLLLHGKTHFSKIPHGISLVRLINIYIYLLNLCILSCNSSRKSHRSGHRRCSTKKKAFRNIHRKAPVLLIKKDLLKPLLKRLQHRFTCEYCKIFKNIYFEEHPRVPVSDVKTNQKRNLKNQVLYKTYALKYPLKVTRYTCTAVFSNDVHALKLRNENMKIMHVLHKLILNEQDD